MAGKPSFTFGEKHHFKIFANKLGQYLGQYWTKWAFLDSFLNQLRTVLNCLPMAVKDGFMWKWTCIPLASACNEFGYNNHLDSDDKKLTFKEYPLKSGPLFTCCKQNPVYMCVQMFYQHERELLQYLRPPPPQTSRISFIVMQFRKKSQIIGCRTLSRFDVPLSGKSGVCLICYIFCQLRLALIDGNIYTHSIQNIKKWPNRADPNIDTYLIQYNESSPNRAHHGFHWWTKTLR